MSQACPHYQALPGPSGFCFFYMRPRAATPVQFHPYCGCRDRKDDIECPTGGYLYKQFFPNGGIPRDPVTPAALEEGEAGGTPARTSICRPRLGSTGPIKCGGEKLWQR